LSKVFLFVFALFNLQGTERAPACAVSLFNLAQLFPFVKNFFHFSSNFFSFCARPRLLPKALVYIIK